MQVLDCIESLLWVLVVPDLAIGVVTDADDDPRVLLDGPDWETFLTAGTAEVANPLHPVVQDRLRALLHQVLSERR